MVERGRAHEHGSTTPEEDEVVPTGARDRVMDRVQFGSEASAGALHACVWNGRKFLGDGWIRHETGLREGKRNEN